MRDIKIVLDKMLRDVLSLSLEGLLRAKRSVYSASIVCSKI